MVLERGPLVFQILEFPHRAEFPQNMGLLYLTHFRCVKYIGPICFGDVPLHARCQAISYVIEPYSYFFVLDNPV